MDWKSLLKAMLGILIPMAYSGFIGKFPSFPFSQAAFGDLILWIIGLAVGGWQLSKAVYRFEGRLMGSISFNWKGMVRAVVSAAVPFVYSLLMAKFPDFPLAEAGFLELILWVVGMMVGGWQVSKSVYIGQKMLLNHTGGQMK